MTTVIHDAVIVTADDRDTVHYGAAIAIDGQRVAAIGPSAEILARYPTAERIDGRGSMVMPGFANTHTHLTMTLARGVFEDLSPPHKAWSGKAENVAAAQAALLRRPVADSPAADERR